MEKDEQEESKVEAQKVEDEMKALKDENEMLRAKLKEKDKLLRGLVKAQIKANVSNGSIVE